MPVLFQRLSVFGRVLILLMMVLLAGTAVQARPNLPDFAALVEATAPGVVNIHATQKVSAKQMIPDRYRSLGTDQLLDDLMKHFFDLDPDNTPFNFDNDARGSGFILSEDGYIVTNHHVVENADEIIVKLSDRREFNAKLVGSDVRSDLAVLKVEASTLPTLKIGSSANLRVGEWVLAIGSPFGFESSATSGIISATGRSLSRQDAYVPFIQTDVAINPGNSGGPLFNLDGEVIGINSQIYSRSGGFMGLSFAIPIDVAMTVINQLKTSGKVSRGWIGVSIQSVDQTLASSFGMLTPSGALVTQVLPDGPAVGKLSEGDVIVSVNGKSVDNMDALPAMVGVIPPGTKVKLGVVRQRERQEIDFVMGERPTDDSVITQSLLPQQTLSQPESKPEILGMQLAPLDAVSREAMSLNEDEGVLVERVTGEPARKAGVMGGDVITLLNGKKVSSPEQLQTMAKALPSGKYIAVLVHRKGSARFLALKMD